MQRYGMNDRISSKNQHQQYSLNSHASKCSCCSCWASFALLNTFNSTSSEGEHLFFTERKTKGENTKKRGKACHFSHKPSKH